MPEDRVEYNPETDGDFEPFGLGYYLPQGFTAFYGRKELPCLAELRAVLEGDPRRYAVEYVKAHRRGPGQSVRLEDLRDIPVGHLVAEAALTLLRRVDAPHPSFTRKHRGLKNIAADVVPMLAKNISEGEELEHVAVIYRIAHAAGAAPTRTVAEALGVSRATAGRWIDDARDRELLGPAIERQPGEVRAARKKPRGRTPRQIQEARKGQKGRR